MAYPLPLSIQQIQQPSGLNTDGSFGAYLQAAETPDAFLVVKNTPLVFRCQRFGRANLLTPMTRFA
jgi:hypothetical protein